MKWPVLVGKTRVQPGEGGYEDWKASIATDCEGRCVYCSIREAENGGIDNFHIDHFRPKSRFATLRDIIGNLFLSCAVCNRFKSNDWPAEPLADQSHAGYVDPGLADYNQVLTVSDTDFRLSSGQVAGRYMIERLYLNRPQLIRYWRARFLAKRIGELDDYVQQVLASAQANPSPELNQLALYLAGEAIAIGKAFREACALPPYQYGETKRPKVKLAGSKRRKKR